MSEQSEIVFFFGAGVESDYEFVLGNKYVLESLLTRRQSLYYSLGNNKYYDDYSKEYLYQYNSVELKDIIKNSLNNVNESLTEEEKKLLMWATSNDNKKDNNPYDLFINEEDNKKDNEKYTHILNNLKYEGKIETFFPNLLKGKSKKIKSRLINYFWSCYFTIIDSYFKLAKDLLEKNGLNIDVNDKSKYNYLLKNKGENLIKCIKLFKSDEMKEVLKRYENTYYSEFQKYKEKCWIVTTNYTFLAENYFGKNVTYLSGRLDEFEDYDDLSLYNIDELNNDLTNKFPFLYTQAYLKPIVSYKYIKKYYEAYEKMVNAHKVIIIGYSLSDNDYHIVRMLEDINKQREKDNKDKIHYILFANKPDDKCCQEEINENGFITHRLNNTKSIINKVDEIYKEMIKQNKNNKSKGD